MMFVLSSSSIATANRKFRYVVQTISNGKMKLEPEEGIGIGLQFYNWFRCGLSVNQVLPLLTRLVASLVMSSLADRSPESRIPTQLSNKKTTKKNSSDSPSGRTADRSLASNTGPESMSAVDIPDLASERHLPELPVGRIESMQN